MMMTSGATPDSETDPTQRSAEPSGGDSQHSITPAGHDDPNGHDHHDGQVTLEVEDGPDAAAELVDDDPVARILARAKARSAGYSIFGGGSGATSLRSKR